MNLSSLEKLFHKPQTFLHLNFIGFFLSPEMWWSFLALLKGNAAGFKALNCGVFRFPNYFPLKCQT